ncbi:MAG: GerMN domain-containing protein [Acidimicrobiia bacterium]|nr:GerMN domain-containing protein [Acidimicrobiia bacterium]
MKRTTIIILGLTMLVAACGDVDVGSAGPVTTRPNILTAVARTTVSATDQGPDIELTSATTTTVVDGAEAALEFVGVYFVQESLQAQVVVRYVGSGAVETEAIRALLDGPTDAERAKGLWTAIPADTLLLGVEISGGVATVDLSREFENGGGTTSILSRLAQVVYTITQFPDVDSVSFRLDGEPVTAFSGEGVVLEAPVTRADYETVLPISDGANAAATEAWGQGDLPSLGGTDSAARSRVVLTSETDAVAVRLNPGTDAPVVGALEPGVVVMRSGLTEIADSSSWVQIGTPMGALWVDGRFLGADVGNVDFENDERVADLLSEFAATIERRGDLRPLVSARGLYLAYNADPILFTPSELEGILEDPTTYQWPSHLISPDDPAAANLPARSFAVQIGDSFTAAFGDPASSFEHNEWIDAAEQGIPEAAIPIPFELRSFNYIAVHNNGDDPDREAINWITWYVSIDYEGGEPRVVAMTFDAWTP